MTATEMTPRERVYAAINHEDADRIPIAFGGNPAGIVECPPNGKSCSQLYHHLAISNTEPIQITDAWNMVTNIDERVLGRFHSDIRQVGPKAPPATLEADGTKTSQLLCGMKVKRLGYYDEPFEFPMRRMETAKDIEEYLWPDPNSLVIMDGIAEQAKRLHDESNYFVLGVCWSVLYPFPVYSLIRGLDTWLLDMKVRPKFYHEFAERLLEIGTTMSDKFFRSVGQYLDGVLLDNDLGGQQGGLISLDDYREFYRPYQARIINSLKQYLRPETKIFSHSCGSVYSYISEFIEVGIDVLNPVQPLARNMEPWRLKSEFGDKIAFMGGFDIQELLPIGTVEQVSEGAKKLIQEYGPGGGFIFATSHNIEPDTNPDNIVAMFDAAYQYGKYPIPPLTGLGYVDYIKSLKLL